MQILRAPNTNTVTRVTSVGEVKFIEGIATDFTPEQAQFFTERQRNYTVEDIETEEEAAEAKAAIDKVTAERIAAEKAAAQEVADEKVADQEALEEETIAEKPTASAGILLEIGDASFMEVRAFAKANGINAGGGRQDIIDRIEKASASSPPSFADIFPNVGIGREASAETSPVEAVKEESPPTGEEEPTASITALGVDLNEVDHPTLVEIAGQYGIEVEETWSTEELRAAMLADEGIQEAMAEAALEEDTGADDETGESTETTEASQGAPDGSQSVPADVSSDRGSGGQEENIEQVKLPTARDSRKVVAQWCRENDVDDQGTKKELLERIYADQRFKQ